MFKWLYFDIPIILQSTGLAHIFGNRKGKYPFESSLCPLLQKAGASVLTVYPTESSGNMTIDMIPCEAIPERPNTVVIESLSEECFERKQREGTQDWADKEAESAFTRSVYAASGKIAKFRDRKSPFEAAWWNAVARRHATEILENYKDKDSDVLVMNSFDLS